MIHLKKQLMVFHFIGLSKAFNSISHQNFSQVISLSICQTVTMFDSFLSNRKQGVKLEAVGFRRHNLSSYFGKKGMSTTNKTS